MQPANVVSAGNNVLTFWLREGEPAQLVASVDLQTWPCRVHTGAVVVSLNDVNLALCAVLLAGDGDVTVAWRRRGRWLVVKQEGAKLWLPIRQIEPASPQGLMAAAIAKHLNEEGPRQLTSRAESIPADPSGRRPTTDVYHLRHATSGRG